MKALSYETDTIQAGRKVWIGEQTHILVKAEAMCVGLILH